MSEITTISISKANRDRLDELGAWMQQQNPGLWSHKPPYSAIVGYALERVLALANEDER